MQSSRQSPPDLDCAAFYVYSPRGSSKICEQAKSVRDAIKRDSPGGISRLIDTMAVRLVGSVVEPFFGPDLVLVPTPGSSPPVRGATWIARKICDELVQRGLAAQVLVSVERQRAVPKAAFQPAHLRPTLRDHLDSMVTHASLDAPTSIVVVDDVVTSGTTLFATSTHVRQLFPDSMVRAFALLRTNSDALDLPGVVEPYVGSISTDGKRVWHRPS